MSLSTTQFCNQNRALTTFNIKGAALLSLVIWSLWGFSSLLQIQLLFCSYDIYLSYLLCMDLSFFCGF